MSRSIPDTRSEIGSCVECGASDCREAFERLLALEYERREPYARFHTITVSAYYLQHPSRGAEGRAVWWEFLHLYLSEGLDAVAGVVRRRQSANAVGAPLPDVRAVADHRYPIRWDAR